jgi:hypothetical protein
VLFVHTEIEHRRSIMMGRWSYTYMYVVYMQNHAWVHFTSLYALPFVYCWFIYIHIYIYQYTISNYATRQNDAIDSVFFCKCICISHKSDFCKENRLKKMQIYFCLFSLLFRVHDKDKWQWDRLIRFNMKFTCQLNANSRRKKKNCTKSVWHIL